jgi:hypothetical protein
MANTDDKAARLAAALRTNLRRRKAQARATDAADTPGDAGDPASVAEGATHADDDPGGAIGDR